MSESESAISKLAKKYNFNESVAKILSEIERRTGISITDDEKLVHDLRYSPNLPPLLKVDAATIRINFRGRFIEMKRGEIEECLRCGVSVLESQATLQNKGSAIGFLVSQ